MPKVSTKPLSAKAVQAMTPYAQMQAEHFLRALLDHAAVDSRKVWRLAGEFGIGRSTLYKVARALGVEFRPLGRRKLWARPDLGPTPLHRPPYHRLREGLREAAGILSACIWDLWGILRRVLGLRRHAA